MHPDETPPLDLTQRAILLISETTGIKSADIKADSILEWDPEAHTLNLDSLDMIELVMAFEEEFNLEIPDKRAREFKTVTDIINYVHAHAVPK